MSSGQRDGDGSWAPAAPKRMRRLFLCFLTLVTIWPTHAIDSNCNVICGRRPLAPSHSRSSQAGGGTGTLPGTWPWMVSIRSPAQTGYRHTCGGSLIGEKWVLTAAHCFRDGSSTSLMTWELAFGATKLSQPGPDAQVRFPKRLVKHQDYEPGKELNDIALVELDEPVVCNDYIQPACLPDASLNVSAMTHCYISGWGFTQETATNPSDILQEAMVDLIPLRQCNGSRWYSGNIRSNNLCAGYEEGGTDACQGDGGGPLMCREERSERYWVVGVTSWGAGCARARRPGVYTSTWHFYDWIQGYIKEETTPPPPPLMPLSPITEPQTQTTSQTQLTSTTEEQPVTLAHAQTPTTSMTSTTSTTSTTVTTSTTTTPTTRYYRTRRRGTRPTRAPIVYYVSGWSWKNDTVTTEASTSRYYRTRRRGTRPTRAPVAFWVSGTSWRNPSVTTKTTT